MAVNGLKTKIKFETVPPPHIPRRFVDAAFDSKTNPLMRQIAEEFLINFDHYYTQGLAPSFFGPPGIGKTHVCAIIAKRLHKMGVPVMWAGVIKALNRLMDYKDCRQGDNYLTLKKNIMTFPVIVLDDFGHMQEYTRTKELFYEIVETRYANKRSTMFTANFEVDNGIQSWDEISQKLSPAVTRRIKSMSTGLLFVGD